jgi:hypothetical protein
MSNPINGLLNIEIELVHNNRDQVVSIVTSALSGNTILANAGPGEDRRKPMMKFILHIV